MFVILAKFSENKSKAGEFMESHNEWIKRGFDDGVFLLVGSLQRNHGGAMIAHNTSISELQERVNNDPFISQNVVNAEILEIEPKKADERLGFLIGSIDPRSNMPQQVVPARRGRTERLSSNVRIQ